MIPGAATGEFGWRDSLGELPPPHCWCCRWRLRDARPRRPRRPITGRSPPISPWWSTAATRISSIAARYAVSPAAVERMNDLSARRCHLSRRSLRMPAKSEGTRRAVLRRGRTATLRSLECTRRQRCRHGARAALSRAAPRNLAEHCCEPHRTASRSPQSQRGGSRACQGNSRFEQHGQSAAHIAGRFEWPVEGRIIAEFGRGGDGERNDGINIATDLGTPIHAAAAGTVTYAGNQLKGYGNLILIRHDNGYITAYAHAESMIVSARRPCRPRRRHRLCRPERRCHHAAAPFRDPPGRRAGRSPPLAARRPRELRHAAPGAAKVALQGPPL